MTTSSSNAGRNLWFLVVAAGVSSLGGRMRGRLVTLYQLGIVLGILGAVYVNMLIQNGGTEEWNQAIGWKWVFMAGAVPAVLFAAVIIVALESPRWLMKVGRMDEGQEVLTRINGGTTAKEETAVSVSRYVQRKENSQNYSCRDLVAPFFSWCCAGRPDADQRNNSGALLSAFHLCIRKEILK